MERKFSITMHAPLGVRHGTMSFNEENSTIDGTLELLGNKSTFKGTITEDGTVEFSGKMTSRLHSFSYFANGTIIHSDLKLNVIGDRYSFCITGEEINLQEGDTI